MPKEQANRACLQNLQKQPNRGPQDPRSPDGVNGSPLRPPGPIPIYIYIYTYIYYTSVNPCITCTKQSGAEQKLIPIKDEQGAALFERPSRTQETNAPHGCGLERHFSSMLRLLGRLERPPSSSLRLQARAAPVEHSAVPGRLERRPSSILRLQGRLEGHLSSILRLLVSLPVLS